MIKNEIGLSRSYIDPFYKPENRDHHFLSLQIGRDGLYAAVMDLSSNTYVALEEHLFEGIQNTSQLATELKSCVKKSKLLTSIPSKTDIGIINEYSLLVPEALYDESAKKGMFEFAQGRHEDYILKEDKLVNLKARNVFALPVELRDVLLTLAPNARIRHASTSLIEASQLSCKQLEGEQLVLHVQYSHFEILHFRDGQLRYSNSFAYTTAEDFIYYVLFTMEQLELNTEKVGVEILGEIDYSSNTYVLLYKYVRNIRFGQRPKGLHYSPALDALPSNHYHNLFNQFLCA